jgi:hypothetical protein
MTFPGDAAEIICVQTVLGPQPLSTVASAHDAREGLTEAVARWMSLAAASGDYHAEKSNAEPDHRTLYRVLSLRTKR